MIKSKFYNKVRNQKRIEDTIQKYYDSINNDSIRSILDQMPKNKETLKIIEEELAKFTENADGSNPKERWQHVMRGVETIEGYMNDVNGESDED